MELAKTDTLCACSYQLNPLYVLITVIAYMMKDRMKEWGKRYLEPVCIKLGFEFPDRIVKVSIEDVMHQHLILRSMVNTAQALKPMTPGSQMMFYMAQGLMFNTDYGSQTDVYTLHKVSGHADACHATKRHPTLTLDRLRVKG